MSLPPTITQTTLWQRALADAGDEHERAAKAQLRVAFEEAREKARKLAEEIPRYLPEFTDHSVDHMDSLWRVADHILPEDYPLNPAEAFVFGCAVLVHDCAMSVAAYPGRMDEIRRHPMWRDLLAQTFRDMRGRRAKPEDLDTPEQEVEDRALGEFLRRNHAAQAENLPLQAWTSADGTYYVISNERLREHFGYTIGVAAHSHHWSVDCLISELPVGPGPLPGFPGRWDIDALKIACLLRVADACHLDERRAPSFSLVLRDLPAESTKHWDFQNRLALRGRERDSLAFASTRPFSVDNSPSWWLACDALAMADRELSTVDAFLREHGREPFAVRRIQGAATPLELARYIRTDGWKPVDARIHVSDVPTIVERLGGRRLYGDQPKVAVRELVQNATDAVRTRGILEGRPIDWGEVTVWLDEVEGEPDRGCWLHVRDNGVGMTERCLTEYLTDFGVSYWRSDLAVMEHPGLHAMGVKHTGIFGIGFFSVFILGERVKVMSRFYKGGGATLVLEFYAGVRQRPILRSAKPTEVLVDPGTEVCVWLDEHARDSLLANTPEKPPLWSGHADLGGKLTDYGLKVLLIGSFPACDVSIHCIEGSERVCAVEANDWIHIPPESLFQRLRIFRPSDRGEYLRKWDRIHRSMSLLRFKDGEIGGRLCLVGHIPEWRDVSGIGESGGVVTKVGGIKIPNAFMRTNLFSRTVGFICGEVSTASRNEGVVVEDDLDLLSWAREQKMIWIQHTSRLEQVMLFHELRRFGLRDDELPIVVCNGCCLKEDEFRKYVRTQSHMSLVIDVVRPHPRIYRLDQFSIMDLLLKLHDEVGTYIFGESYYGMPSLQDYITVARNIIYELVNELGNKQPMRTMRRYAREVDAGAYIVAIICEEWQVSPAELFRGDTASDDNCAKAMQEPPDDSGYHAVDVCMIERVAEGVGQLEICVCTVRR